MSISEFAQQKLASVMCSQTAAQSITDAVETLEAGGATEVLSVYADATARDAAIASPVAGQMIYNTELGANQTYDGTRWRVDASVVTPSGDATGVTDAANIQSQLDDHNYCRLGVGTFTVDQAITFAKYDSIFGDGQATLVTHVDDSTAIFSVTVDRVTIADLQTNGGLYSIHIDGGKKGIFRNVFGYGAASHGVYITGKSWGLRFFGGTFSSNGGDGINSVSTAADFRGNAMSIVGTEIGNNTGHGLSWGAICLYLSGCHIESNTDSGCHIIATGESTTAANVVGNYFENNGTANIEIESANSKLVAGVYIQGNSFSPVADTPSILATSSAADMIYYLTVGASNYFTSSGTALEVDLSDFCVRGDIYVGYRQPCDNPEDNNVNFMSYPVDPLDTLFQGAPAAIADGDTAITAANIQSRILTMASSTAGRAPTVPTGNEMYVILMTTSAVDWTFINTGNQTVTITAAANHTLVGGMALTAGTQGAFRTRVSAANTAITYRLA